MRTKLRHLTRGKPVGSSQTPRVAKGNLELISLSHSTPLTDKDKTIELPCVLISFSYTRNKKKNPSTR